MSTRSFTHQTLSKPERVQVIINPAPSRRVALLAILNQAFRDAGIAWDVSLTHEPGDGTRLAREAVDSGADVIAVYGGDGTLMEVASGMLGTDVPMLVLGGGTGNLVASELRLPTNLEKTCELICGDQYETRHIDVGRMGERTFLLRVGCGIEVGVVQEATREMKDRLGKWAYVWAAIKKLQEIPEADYEIRMDDQETVRSSGVACVVANAGTVGVGRLTLAPSVEVNDGYLDVFLLRRAGIEGMVQVANQMMGLDWFRREEQEAVDLDASEMASHWRAQSIDIRTDPVLDIQVDGDVVAATPQVIEVMPAALRVVV